MRIVTALLAIAAGVAPLAARGSEARGADATAPIITIDAGKLQGARRGEIDAFLGVPYASPPLGPLRWRAPQPVSKWTGVRTATTFAPSCFQEWPPRPFGPYTAEYVDTPQHSEDCLYLNVWAPAARNGKMPVLVWIHGGGFGGGSGAVPIYDGTRLAAKALVVVTINYRVGPFGFLAHPDLTREAGKTGAGNYGLQDMIAALGWVHDHVAAFGGDPARVTIAGQSAGAVAVNDLLVSPQAARLFARAIAQSGSGMGIDAIPLADAERNGVEFARQVGVTSLAELRLLPPERIQAAIPSYFTPPAQGARARIPFRPVLDGAVVPVDPIDGSAKVASNVPLLTGFNADEFMPLQLVNRAEFASSMRAKYGAHAERLLALYPAATDDEANAAARLAKRDAYLSALLLWADARARTGMRVHAYLYEHPAPVSSGPGFGTFHSSEIPYLFGVLDRTVRPFTAADDAISEQLQTYWLNFVRTGDPNGAGVAAWAAFEPGARVVMGLGDRVGPRAPVSSAARFAAFEAYARDGGRLSVL